MQAGLVHEGRRLVWRLVRGFGIPSAKFTASKLPHLAPRADAGFESKGRRGIGRPERLCMHARLLLVTCRAQAHEQI